MTQAHNDEIKYLRSLLDETMGAVAASKEQPNNEEAMQNIDYMDMEVLETYLDSDPFSMLEEELGRPASDLGKALRSVLEDGEASDETTEEGRRIPDHKRLFAVNVKATHHAFSLLKKLEEAQDASAPGKTQSRRKKGAAVEI